MFQEVRVDMLQRCMKKRKAANFEMNVYGKKERSFIVLIRMSKNGLVLKRKCHLNIQLSDVVCVIFL